MRKSNWTRRDPIKNYFPLPNEIYSLGLSAGAIAVYGFLMRIENRQTYQCTITYTTSEGTRSYKVETVRKIASNDWSYLEPTCDNRITLITCVAGDYSVRWCVQAVER